MSTEIYEQTASIHQLIREFVEKRYPSYRVYAIRNNSTTFYADQVASVIEFSVDAEKGSKDLYCNLTVNGGVISVISAKEGKNKFFS